MKMKIAGIQKLDFDTKEGNHITGTNLFVAYKDERVIGQKTDKIFISNQIDLPAGIKPGDDIEVFFNMRGKVDAIQATKN